MPRRLKAWLNTTQAVCDSLLQHMTEEGARSWSLQCRILQSEHALMQSQADFWRQLEARQALPSNLLSYLPNAAQLQKEWQALPEAHWKEQLKRLAANASEVNEHSDSAAFGHLPEWLLNSTQRRQKGVYYTPKPLVDYLCKGALERHLHQTLGFALSDLHALLWQAKASPELLQQGPALIRHLAQIRSCDPACGGGLLLSGLLQCLQQLEQILTPKGPPVNWLNGLYGIELDPLAAAVTRWRLWQAAGCPTHPTLHIFNGNPLSHSPLWKKLPKFELTVANPPYLGEKGHKYLFENLRQGPLGHFYQARSDLAYYFFHWALDNSKKGGICAFLSTNYFLTASQASTLRADLQNRAIIHKLTDFHEWRLFKGAQGQHNLVSFFEKNQASEAPCLLLFCEQTGSAQTAPLYETLAQDEILMKRAVVLQKNLFNSETGQIQQPIRLDILDHSLEGILTKLKSLRLKLKDCVQIHQGVVTGADRMSVKHQQKFALSGTPGEGIFVLNEHERQALQLSDQETALLKPWFKNSDIAPWHCSQTASQWIIYADRQCQFNPDSRLYQHLQRFQPLLAERREVAQGRFPWWQLHWPRQVQIFTGPKLVLPQRHRKNLAAWNQIPWFASADVYFITAAERPELLWDLLVWLNSPLAWLWLSCEGKRKGRLLELYARPLSELPVLTQALDAPTQKHLIAELRQNRVLETDFQEQIWHQLFKNLDLTPHQQAALLKAWREG